LQEGLSVRLLCGELTPFFVSPTKKGEKENAPRTKVKLVSVFFIIDPMPFSEAEKLQLFGCCGCRTPMPAVVPDSGLCLCLLFVSQEKEQKQNLRETRHRRRR
jgi:hypothetical protein